MAVNAETAAPIEADLPLLSSDDIQGNILAPFNKPCQRFLFISFRNRQQDARNWLAEFLGEVAFTAQVVEHGEARKQAELDGEPVPQKKWVSVSFTSSGLVTLHPELATDLVAFDAFWQGPVVDREYRGARRSSPAVVGDVHRGEPAHWVVGGPGQYPVDALVTVAADDEKSLADAAEIERARAAGCELTVLSWQDCARIGEEGKGEEARGTEPFGFRDGISQPGVRGFTAAEDRDLRREAVAQAGAPIIATGEFVLGYVGEGGSYPDARRPVPPAWMGDGSFQVFLRLRQDVGGWTTAMRELRESSKDDIDVAAKVIGRTTDGEPLASPGTGPDFNDFTYDEDPQGVRTPRFAHIRKMNPRNGTFDDRTHRLLRRGIPFAAALHVETRLPADEPMAEPIVEPIADPIGPGLAFNAFMSSIENQFEFLQRSWASSPESVPPVAADGPDPLVGASDAPCVLRRADADPVEIHFSRFVWTSGAVYAFAPSRSALGRLAGADPIRGERA